jgi:uncharacterized membrane protein
VITVLGVVFSVTIVALTLASQQFGPHAAELHPGLRRTQATLGSFVATFVYAVLTLGAIGGGTQATILMDKTFSSIVIGEYLRLPPQPKGE